MLNKSVLTIEDIEFMLKEYYFINNLREITTVSGGSACIYRVSNNLDKYIIKEYQNGYSFNSINDEFAICNYLNLNGIKTSELLKNKFDSHYVEIKNKYITVQKYIDGYVYKQNEAPAWLMTESAQLLGKINAVLMKYKIKKYEFKSEWFNTNNFDKKIKEYEKYIWLAKENNDKYTDRIISDIEYKINKIKNLNKTEFDNEKLTYANSHGDYNLLQLLCKNRKINAVIDFASACNLPIAWEIIRSFTYADRSCKDTKIDINSLIKYLENYLLFYPLKEYDIKNIFNVYLIQLLRSAYGYKEYFMDGIYDKEKLIEFGLWRTNLLKNILENENEYTNCLLVWFKNR